MSVTVKIQGMDKLMAQLAKASTEAKAGVQNAVYKGADVIRGEAVCNISRGSRSGKKYPRGKGRIHIASAPGEFPKTDFGELVANINVRPEPGAGGFAVTVGSRIQAPQGYWLETKLPSEGGRPWLAPVVKKTSPFVFNLISAAVKKAIEGK